MAYGCQVLGADYLKNPKPTHPPLVLATASTRPCSPFEKVQSCGSVMQCAAMMIACSHMQRVVKYP